jgi:hypothetical protein
MRSGAERDSLTSSHFRFRLVFFPFSLRLSFYFSSFSVPAERAIFDLEHKNNWYGVLSYFVARSLVDVPFQILFPSVYGAIVYWMAGLNDSFDRFVLWEVVLVLHVLVTQSFGILISCATRSPSLAVVLAPVTAIPQLLFCGFFVLIDNIPGFLRWIQVSRGAKPTFCKLLSPTVLFLLLSNKTFLLPSVLPVDCLFQVLL